MSSKATRRDKSNDKKSNAAASTAAVVVVDHANVDGANKDSFLEGKKMEK